MKNMYIVADENMALVKEFFTDLGELHCYAGRSLTQQQLLQATALLVRSVTTVNQALLHDTPVSFVGSATIGADHLDINWLSQQGITTTTAPACNARSVVEYVFACLAYLQEKNNHTFLGKTLGIVGLGNVGNLLAKLGKVLGFNIIGCDPFVTRDQINQLSLEALLSQADIICLHTPLTKQGAYPTYHLLGEHNLSLIKQGAVLLNAGRGAAIDNQALSAFLQQHPNYFSAVILDVWESEPTINQTLVEQVQVATPHIAGYSLEGKWRGTEMIYQAFCQHIQQTPQHKLADFLPVNSEVLVWPNQSSLWQNYATLLRHVYPVERDDQALRQTMFNADKLSRGQAFDHLRKTYWPRRECSAYHLSVTQTANIPSNLFELGFCLAKA